MGMTASYVALTALTDQIRMEELARVAAALQRQVAGDFAPLWHANAVIAAASFEAIPAGYVPLIVQDTLEAEGANGFHRTLGDDTPYIVIPYGPNWPLAASHELLRMLANPTGSLRQPGPSRMSGQGTVEYLIDVCAACQHVDAAYAIDGVAVSDFCTPQFFGGGGGSAYSFTGSVRAALEPAPGGVVTWLADDGLLYQARADLQSRVRVHGGFSPANRGRMLLRELVDRLTPERLALLSHAPRTAHLLDAEQNARRSRFTNLTRFREDIAWRFGHASVSRPELEPRHETVRLKTYASGAVKSGQQPASAELESTLRTAS
jgi:hypothetical protein